jgi:hydroxymethylbilane synthase
VRDILDPDVCLPAPCQGALGITARRDDPRVLSLLNPIQDRGATVETDCERAFLIELSGGCVIPAGGLAELDDNDDLRFRTFLSHPNGSAVLRREGSAPAQEAEKLGRRLARELLAAGGEAWVRAARDLA